MNIHRDYAELLELFEKHRVKYCIVGAYAVAFYAISRYTKDLDLFVEPNIENGKKVLQALTEFGFKLKNIKASEFETPGVILQFGVEPIRIDIINEIDGCTFQEVWKGRKRGFYGPKKYNFIGLKELTKNKKKSGRKIDAVDLEVLAKLSSQAKTK